MDLSAIALQDLQQADVQLQAAASNLANAGASTPDGANLDVLNLSSQIVALNSAKTLVDLNLSTLRPRTR